ncbi:unnamed protein product [Rotaria sp. Silwood1]|nr:unnamed protein product [Rotaria sp. Silwood1]
MSKIANFNTTQKNTSAVPKKEHYVCQYSGCNNRCDSNCIRDRGCYGDVLYDGYTGSVGDSSGPGGYSYSGGDYLGDECEKCGRGFLGGGFSGLGYRCKKCGHLYCYNCCFK